MKYRLKMAGALFRVCQRPKQRNQLIGRSVRSCGGLLRVVDAVESIGRRIRPSVIPLPASSLPLPSLPSSLSPPSPPRSILAEPCGSSRSPSISADASDREKKKPERAGQNMVTRRCTGRRRKNDACNKRTRARTMSMTAASFGCGPPIRGLGPCASILLGDPCENVKRSLESARLESPFTSNVRDAAR